MRHPDAHAYVINLSCIVRTLTFLAGVRVPSTSNKTKVFPFGLSANDLVESRFLDGLIQVIRYLAHTQHLQKSYCVVEKLGRVKPPKRRNAFLGTRDPHRHVLRGKYINWFGCEGCIMLYFDL